MEIKELISLLEELIQIPNEQTWLEFKTNVAEHHASVTPEGIGEYISALANGACISNKDFGYLVLGIEDKTNRVIGTNFVPSVNKIGNQDYELWLRTLVEPKIKFEIFEFEYQSQQLILFRIPSAKGEPVNFKHKPYIRINSQKTELKNYPAYIRDIYNSLEDWSSKIIEGATFEDLDSEALKIARLKFKEKSINEPFYNDIDNWNDSQLLDKAKITINGKITNTALLLLGKSESTHYLSPSIAEITWKLETDEQAYEHFTTPLLLNTTNILNRIRNIKYKFFPDNALLAVEVNKYETRVILEALHNAIAHQDYSANQRIILSEKIDKLMFRNAGGFYSGKPDEYILGNKTPDKYRNPFLSKAMVNLNMIDTVGYGIHTMYLEQRKRFFPLPDYSKSDETHVILEIFGHAIDENYSLLLMQKSDLPLSTVVILDRVQKKLPIPDDAVQFLKKQNFLEGRKPNYYVAARIAESTGVKADYIKNKSFDDRYFKDLILEYLRKFKKADRADIEELLLDKLSEVLTHKQKKDKVKNLLQSLRLEESIGLEDKYWFLK